MDRYQQKPLAPKVTFQVDPYVDFQGGKAELFFIKVSSWLRDRRKPIFVGVGVLTFFLIIFTGYMEYHNSQVEKASILLENLHKLHKEKPKDISLMITDFEKIRSEYGNNVTKLRTSKNLADLMARNGEFAKAAKLMEEAGTEIDELREMKALYFYIAGNYREQAKDIKQSLVDYETAATLLNNMRNLSTFMAWTYFHTGRLSLLNGNKDNAVKYLKKVMELNGSSEQFQKARELSTYLLLKINQ